MPRVCLVTGATSGHGRACAFDLAGRGERVCLLGRNPKKLEHTRDQIAQKTGNRPTCLLCDLSRPKDIHRAADEFLSGGEPLHLLLNNAGLVRRHREETPGHLEMTFAVNYLSMFHLTLLLLPRLMESRPARVVNVASDAHRVVSLQLDDLQSERGYQFMLAYSRSKLAVLYFTVELARHLDGSGVTVNAVDPGPVASGIADGNPGLAARLASPLIKRIFPAPEKAARTALMLCNDQRFDRVSGRYYRFMKEKAPRLDPKRPDTGERLCQMSAALTGLRWPP